MRYISTRGHAADRDFPGVLLAGLAEDGGLFVPQSWPHLSQADLRALRGQPYPTLAARVIQPFIGEAIPYETLHRLCQQAYAGFRHPATVPLVQLDTNLWSLELFHGPTLAFKDMAMQLLGHLFDHVLEQSGQRITIVGATSGDTGSAAIEAMRGRARVDIVILHPKGRTSEVQRRQMTTVDAPNVHNIAIDGNFDDCQDLVKAMFADKAFRESVHLSAVNSINWARIAAQIPYYIASALAVGAPDRAVGFAVPTGNFGNVLAAWAARRIGLPVASLIVASNHNDILTRFLAANDMSVRDVVPSLSPSMDIGVSSNFERLLFELLDRDPARTAATMRQFRDTGRMSVSPDIWQRATALLHGARFTDAATLAEITRLQTDCAYLADPHSAIGIAAARAHLMAHPDAPPFIAAATAHPAKFPDAMQQATGHHPALPPHLADLYQRPELYTERPNDLAIIEADISAFAHARAAARTHS